MGNLVDERLDYVIRFFIDRMNEKEKRAYKHLLVGVPFSETEQRLLDGLAWEESKGKVLPDLGQVPPASASIRLIG